VIDAVRKYGRAKYSQRSRRPPNPLPSNAER
jgi:hypothetical protein